MTLEEAKKVVSAYGGFIEFARWRLNAVFFDTIPESLLPYSLDSTNAACVLLAEYFYKQGHKEHAEDIERCMCWLQEFKDDEQAMLEAMIRLKDRKWQDASFDIMSKGRDVHKGTTSKYFKEIPFEKVDFNNLTFYTARTTVDIYFEYLTRGHIPLAFIFSEHVPESFLPFLKKDIEKALVFYAGFCGLTGKEDLSEAYIYGKNILGSDYVNDRESLAQLIKNLSDKAIRNSIIVRMKRHQYLEIT
ncbi:MAG: hypothetical protein HQL22_09575 [Candidatus Omnitrophica bacterium]|nr:hypothetical protein [Candidatus Omnitrophota bacterium]